MCAHAASVDEIDPRRARYYAMAELAFVQAARALLLPRAAISRRRHDLLRLMSIHRLAGCALYSCAW